jgi:hypothetical protein
LKPPGGINMTKVEIRVEDHLKTPYNITDLGDIQVCSTIFVVFRNFENKTFWMECADRLFVTFVK